MNSQILKETLEKQGFQVLTADNGNDGLRILKEEKFTENDVILVDMNMPQMSGLEFVDRAKRAGGKSDMKIYTRGSIPNEYKILAHRVGAASIEGFEDVMVSIFARLNNVVNQTEQRLKHESL